MRQPLINIEATKCHGSSWEGASKGNSRPARRLVSKLSLGSYTL